ncbi:MAG: hypothetical protein D6773_18985, partial [Alphaproteobacteria bacterium]
MKDLVGSDRRKAASFVLTGLPIGQKWLGRAIAEALEIPSWSPDIAGWVAQSPVKWNARPQPMDLGTNAIGMLQVVADDPCEKDENRIWRVRWFGQDVTEKAESSDNEEQVLKEAAEASARLKASLQAEAAQKAALKKASATKPLAPKKTGRVRLKARSASTPSPAPEEQSAKDEAAASPSRKQEPPVRQQSRPEQAPKRPAEKKTVAKAAEKPAQRRKGKLIGALSMAAGIALMAGFGYMYFQKVEEQKQIAEQRAAAEALARQQAEEEARRAAEEKRLAEEKAAREAAEAEAARRLAEEKERKLQEELERLRNARGAVIVMTEPEGATVKLGNLAPMTTPARFRDV